jgi:hypothetical protein
MLTAALVTGCVLIGNAALLLGCADDGTAVKGKVFYVSPDGSDRNSGSKGAPFRTIAKGISKMRPGTTTYVRSGTYRERVTARGPRCSPKAPCVLRNAPGERPVLKGLLWLDGGSSWTIDGLGVKWDPRDSSEEHMVKVIGGSDWTLKRMEMSGAHSFANLLVAGNPRSWRVSQNCIHDTYPSNDVNQDHNVYVNTGSGGRDGLIDRNLLYNATNGANLKLGGSSVGSSRTSGVVVSHNTMWNAAQNIVVTGGSHDIRFDRNITARAALRSYRAYRLTGEDVALESGLTAQAEAVQHADPGFRSLAVDGVETVDDPQFDRIGCDGFRPGNATAQTYGAFAP